MKSDSDKVQEYLNHLSVEKALAKNTIISYSQDLQRFQEFLLLNHCSTEELTEELMSDFVAWLRGRDANFARLSESSISRSVIAIRNFAKFTFKELGEINPIQDFHPPKIPKRLPKSLSVSEVTSLIESAELAGDAVTLRDLALIEFLYATGARISEAVSLTIHETAPLVAGEVDAIKLRGKGGKERVVPVGKFARDALSNYLIRTRPLLLGSKRTSNLFLNLRGDALSRQSACGIISAVAERARLNREVTPHSLRHSFATHLLDGGADIRVVQELLGHSSVTTTQIYTLVTIDKLRESYSLAHPRAK